MANKQFLDKEGVDYLTQGLKAKIPTKVSQLTNDSGYKTTDNDTKNTAGSTDTSSKIFLIGATSQAANPQTYSHDTAYVGTDGCLYSGSKKVLTDHQSLSGLVPTSRTVNGKALSSNITLTASDVGALPNTTTIPTVNNATLTIQKNGTTVKTFTANSSTNVTANITVPTKTSELTNDSGFLTLHQDISGKVNKSGDTMSGNLTISKATPILSIKSTDNTTAAAINMGHAQYNTNAIIAYPSTVNGYNLAIQSGGITAIGSGEAATNFMSAIGTNKDQEILYLLSDNQIHLETNAQTIGNRVGYQIDNSGNIIPEKAEVATNNFGSLGTSSYKLANVYATTIHGALDGNATTATTLKNLYTSSTRPTDANIASTKSVAGNGGIATFKATSSMTANKPATDSHIIHFYWDNDGGYDAQLALDAKGSAIQYRGQNGGTWSAWKTAAATKFANGYWGMAKPDGTDQDWIRTTYNGIIPYQSGTTSNIGTSSWTFAHAWISNVHVRTKIGIGAATDNGDVTIQYNSTDKCLEFNFN